MERFASMDDNLSVGSAALQMSKESHSGRGQGSLIIGYLKDQLYQTQKEPFGAVVV